uniref:Adenylate kinase 9 n=1 Tax=Stegastes partitus TaxID=144197 RepID=A0A3B5A2W7_9TELE
LFVDKLTEDEAERESLVAKPTCFIVVGKPGVGKSTLARKIAESWRCVLIDTDLLSTHIESKTKEGIELLDILSEGRSIPEDVVMQLILARLNSPDVEHYYVLSCLPFMSEECLKIHEQIELIKNLKLSPDFIINIKQCADKDLVQRLSGLKQHPETGKLYSRDQWKRDEVYNKTRDIKDQDDYMMRHHPLYLLELDGNNTAEELQSVMSHLGSMAIKREDLLRNMSSTRTVAPGFRWRRSRWGRTCPVALKEGKAIPGKPELSVFQDKVYILSSHEAYQKFVTNPRRYLLPPMPRLPCRVSIIGPTQAGKSPVCKLLAQHYNAVVLDMEELLLPALTTVEKERLDKIKNETTQVAIEKIKMKTEDHPEVQALVLAAVEEAKHFSTSPLGLYAEVLERRLKEIEEADSDAECRTGWVLDNFPRNLTQMDALQQAGILPDIVFCLRDSDGHENKLDPDGPETNEYKLSLQQFVSEWDQMQSALTVTHCVLEIGSKSPENLLQEMIQQMEKRLLGDTHHFCPVALKNHNVLRPCTDEIAAKYREKIFYFSSLEARDSFLQNPEHFVAQTEPLKPPALRIFLLGTRGSGKTTNGEWLAQHLGLFHIQFREHLQTLIMAKTKKRVPCADEVASLEDDSQDLEEVVLTDEEMAIKAYLSSGDPLNPQILDMVIATFWKQEPYSTGFILEGFPHTSDEVEYMLHHQLFPDVVVVMEVDVQHVQNRLLPTYLDNWRERRNKREAQLKLLRDLRKKKREESMSKRRAELMAEQDPEREEADEEDNEGTENEETEETEDAATERLEMEIEKRFETDENNLATVMELLIEQNIPKLAINATRKLKIVQNQLLQRIQPLLTNRESIFQTCQPISYRLANKLLLSSYKLHSAFGCCDPIKESDLIQPLQWPLSTSYPLLFHQYIYFFTSKENRNTFMLNPLKYLRQPKPTPSLPVRLAVTGPPKSGKTTAQMFAQKHGLARLSIGSVMRMVLDTQEHTDLAIQMKSYLSQGLVVPDELAIQCLEVALMSTACSTGYVLDGFPMTLKQAELMGFRSIIPMIVVELELDTVEVLKRGAADKMKPNPYLMHDSPESLHISTTRYREEVKRVRHHFQQQYQNWCVLDGLKSKWWLWNNILKEISISMKYIHTYLERMRSQAACINRLCITPRKLEHGLGEFKSYCSVCLALHYHLVDCSETAALTHAAVYRGRYYRMCSENHLEKFLSAPDQFVPPGCPHTLPQAHLLPRKLTELQVKTRFPQQVEMKGFCPVTYLDGKQYEALVQGKREYAVEYKGRIYIFETKQKQDKFLEAYWDQKLPRKVPPLSEPVALTSLPTLGYLEQGVANAVIKAMTAVGCLKPKYPFHSIQRSALLYVAFYLKFNPKSSDRTRQMYKKKLALFEENCALIPDLSSAMSGNYRPPSERPIDFEFKLNRFL